MQEPKFYICSHCGNIVEMIHDAGVPIMCCGQKMTLLTPNTTEASEEKHLPVCRVSGAEVSVSVGAAPHPMTEEHSIQWICLVTDQGTKMRRLTPQDAPEAVFTCCTGESPVAVYAYCNLHGLWKTQV